MKSYKVRKSLHAYPSSKDEMSVHNSLVNNTKFFCFREFLDFQKITHIHYLSRSREKTWSTFSSLRFCPNCQILESQSGRLLRLKMF